MRILFLGKRGHWATEKAVEFLQTMPAKITLCTGARGDPMPEEAVYFNGDMIVSFSSPWIVPASMRSRATWSINFHPGSPEYPGIGCTNFALYEGAETFGATCHHMADPVDSGPIIAVSRVPVFETDTVKILTDRTYFAMFGLFVSVMTEAFAGPLPVSQETWTRKAFTRRQLDELCRCTPDMPADEIARRVRATVFPGYQGAYVEIGGQRFEAK